MSIGSRIRSALVHALTPDDDGYYWGGPHWGTPSTTMITAESAMTIPVVYACVSVIAETIASVPLDMFERVNEDVRRSAPNHPIDDLLHDQPNEYQTAIEFREMMTAFAILRGKGIAEIRSGQRGAVDSMVPLHPDLIRREVTATGQVRYPYRDPLQGGQERILLPEDLLIVRGRFGVSVLDFARNSLGSALALEEYGKKVWERGARTPSTLTHPKNWQEPARENLRKALDSYSASGANAGRPMLLEEGMVWTSIGLSNEDAQFVETSQASVATGCRWFRVPPHKVADLSRATFSNIEHQAIEFVTDCIRPWAVRWEQAIKRDLIIAKGRFYAEHNLEALLRGDIKSRAEAYAILRRIKVLNADEIRKRENLNPIPDGSGQVYENPDIQVDQPSRTAAAMARTFILDSADRLVRREQSAVAKLWTAHQGEDRDREIRDYYIGHARAVSEQMHVRESDAARYAAGRCHRVMLEGPGFLSNEDEDPSRELADLSIDLNTKLLAA